MHLNLRVTLVLALIWTSGCASGWPNLARPVERSKPTPASNDLAIIVAIEDYERLANIPGATENARALAAWMRDGRGMRPTRVRLIQNADATAARIISALTHAVQELRAGERLWFVFIGHGMSYREVGKDGATTSGLLIAADAPRDAMRLSSAGVRYPDIERLLANVDHVVLLDACFSGVDRLGEPLAEGLQPIVWSMPVGNRRGATLTASTGLQFAGQLPEGSVPAFSYLATGALRGWADMDHDGRITASEVRLWTHEALQTLDSREQHPTLTGDENLVLSESMIEPPPELADIRRPEPLGPWLMIGLGAAALAGGIAFNVLNQRAYDDTAPWRTKAEVREVKNLGYLGIAGYTLGGIGMASGIIWRIGGDL